MSARLRIGISGAGRVFERLYLPALTAIPSMAVVALADPVAGRCAAAGPSAGRFPSLAQLLAATEVDAIIVLSPPAHHAADASLALLRGLPVLVEKPLCVSINEVSELRALGAEELLTPALSRRYWSAYRRVASRGPVHDLRIAIALDPAGWAAHGGPTDVAEDIFPHIADLGHWLTRSDIASLSARRTRLGFRVAMEMSDGARVSARVDVRAAYREAVRADGRSLHVGPPQSAESLARRLIRRPDHPVQAIAAMLGDWAASLRGMRPPVLPAFEDGAAAVAAMEQLRTALNT